VSDDLFPEIPGAPRLSLKDVRVSADRARTLRAKDRIARGVHPFGAPLRSPAGEKCATCIHLREKEMRSRKMFFKCARNRDTNGPGTDLRKSWPACVFWEVKP
jgi:hypothetical protein